jgi:hypothetical protein
MGNDRDRVFAGRCPELIDRLVFFGPIARREPAGEENPAARLAVDLARGLVEPLHRDRSARRTAGPVAPSFRGMGRALSRYRPGEPNPFAGGVKVPSGAFQDIYDAGSGEFAYDPSLVHAPIAIRGEWDVMCSDRYARWLFDALSASPIRRDIKIGCATHLMHLKTGRYALYRETEAFLFARDMAPPVE